MKKIPNAAKRTISVILSSFLWLAFSVNAHASQCNTNEILNRATVLHYFDQPAGQGANGWDRTFIHPAAPSLTLSISTREVTSLAEMDADLYRLHIEKSKSGLKKAFAPQGYKLARTSISENNLSWKTVFSNRQTGISAEVQTTMVSDSCELTTAFTYPTATSETTAISSLGHQISLLPELLPKEGRMTLKSDRDIPYGLSMFGFALGILAPFGLAAALAVHVTRWNRNIYLNLYQKTAIALPALLGSLFASIEILNYITERSSLQNMELLTFSIISIFLIGIWLTSIERHHAMTLVSFQIPGMALCLVYLGLEWAWVDRPLVVWLLGSTASLVISSALFKRQKAEHELDELITERDKKY